MSTHSETPSRSGPDPFRVLPPEVVGEIFEACTLPVGADPLAAVRLAQVCRTWRDVAYASPRVWTECRLDTAAHPVTRLGAIAQYWLQRARALPVDLDMTFHSPSELLPILAPFINSPAHLKSCTLTSRWEKTVQPFRVVEDGEPSRMEMLDLYFDDELEDDDDPLDSDSDAADIPLYSHTTTFNQESRLKSLVLCLPALPATETMIPFATLTSLSLSLLHPTKAVPTITQLLDFLSLCPALMTLRFAGMQEEMTDLDKRRGPNDPRPFMKVATLPALHSLTLYNTCSVRGILAHLHTPALTDLHLLYLNQDWVMGLGYTDDADDPPLPPPSSDTPTPAGSRWADFSQSPHTDRATGLGFRSLLERSCPPIRTLMMDYGDMRTDDFRWCFEHLPELETFMIVASDMADRVLLHMLGVGDVDAPAPAVAGVVVPKLRSLDLRRCQRLTGDVIERAVASRTAYARAHPSSCAALEFVRIAECGGFVLENERAVRKAVFPGQFEVTVPQPADP